jgi:hypothetical protein
MVIGAPSSTSKWGLGRVITGTHIFSGHARSSGAMAVPVLTWEAVGVTVLTLAFSGYFRDSLLIPGGTIGKARKFLGLVSILRGGRLFQV